MSTPDVGAHGQPVRPREGFLSRVPYHPLLVPLCFAITVYARNRFEAEPGDVLVTVLALMLGATLLLLALRVLFRSWRHAAAAATALLFFLFYEPSLLLPLEPNSAGSVAVFAMAAILLLLVLLRLRRMRTHLAALTLVLNVVVLVMPLPDLWVLAGWIRADRTEAAMPERVYPDLPAPAGSVAATAPDIWLLVPDRYASASLLKDHYRFDNSAFIEGLRKRGFVVRDNAYANYQRTAVSMASMLNLDYLDAFLPHVDGIDSRDWRPIYRALEDNRVSRFLSEAGYRIHRFGSYWEPTRRDPYADEHHNVFDMPDFAFRLLSVSVAGQLAFATGWGGIDGWYSHCQRLQRQFDGLIDLARRDERKYVLAHLLITHPPFVMDEEGRCQSTTAAAQRDYDQRYLDSVAVTNAAFERLIDVIQAGKRPAIILLIADEGPWPGGVEVLKKATFASAEMVDWTAMTDRQLAIKTGILMAQYFPDPAGAALPADQVPVSPVNVFRTVFRHYFALDLPPLPDRYFIYRDDESLYSYDDVTARLPR